MKTITVSTITNGHLVSLTEGPDNYDPDNYNPGAYVNKQFAATTREELYALLDQLL